MPSTRVSTGLWAETRSQEVLEAVQAALIEGLKIPETDRDVVLDIYDPANRIGHAVWTAAELKTMQEVITLMVFAAVSVLYLGETLSWNHAIGFALIAGGAAVVFLKPLG
ncbi:MAG: DMT family protein [Alphaproteobacteria bacterium]